MNVGYRNSKIKEQRTSHAEMQTEMFGLVQLFLYSTHDYVVSAPIQKCMSNMSTKQFQVQLHSRLRQQSRTPREQGLGQGLSRC